MNERYLHIQYPETKNQKLKECDACRMSKSHKTTIHKKAKEETQPRNVLDVVVSDLKQMPVVGLGGKKYVGNFIDKKSRYTAFLYTSTLKTNGVKSTRKYWHGQRIK